MDWTRMQKWGKDDMVVILMSLVWWGKASIDTEWLKAVQDISKVLHCMQAPPAICPSPTATTQVTPPRVNRKCKAPEIENPNGAVVGHKQPLHTIQ